MTVERLEDDKLQQYFDGELADGEAGKVREAIEASEDERARLVALKQLHAHVVMHSKMQHPGASPDEIFAHVTAGIAQEVAEGRHETLRPVEGGGKSARPEVVEPRAKPVEGWKVWIPVMVGAAAAAAVLVFAFAGDGPTAPGEVAEGDLEIEIEELEPEIEVEEPGITIVEAPQGSEVEEVDFGDNVGTVFNVEGDAGEPIAVVWIMDDELETATR